MNSLYPMKKVYYSVYMLSYVILMFSSLIGIYSAYDNIVTGSVSTAFASFTWNVGFPLFIFLQIILSVINFTNIRKIVLFFCFFLLFIVSIFFKLRVVTLATLGLFLLVYNSNFLNFYKILKIDLWIRIISIVSLSTMYFIGFFPSEDNVLVLRGSVLRLSMGFNHPNVFGSYYLYLIISLLLYVNSVIDINYLSVYKKAILFLFVLFSGGYVEFILADSRSSQIALIIIILGLFIYLFYKFNAPSAFYGLLVACIMLILTYYFVSSYNELNPFMRNLNDLLSNRLYLQHDALKLYGVGFVGNQSFAQGMPFWIDDQYLFNLFAVGVIGSIIYFVFIMDSFINARKGNDFILFVIILSIVIKTAVESNAIDFYAFIPFIYSFKYKMNNVQGDRIYES
jgi:hypothetical protein